VACCKRSDGSFLRGKKGPASLLRDASPFNVFNMRIAGKLENVVPAILVIGFSQASLA
jgi:hypothetical protein